MTQDRPEHIRTTVNWQTLKGRCVCDNCGDTEFLLNVRDTNETVGTVTAFVDLHRECKYDPDKHNR